jgi:hypothetical protein
MPLKKPDTVVYNSQSESYDASVKPYGTDLGAPAIEVLDTVAWKNKNVHLVNAQFKAKYAALKDAFDLLLTEFEYNDMIYASKFNFEPIVGKVYHLYRDKKSALFLSLIAPQECRFDFVGSFYLNDDKVWMKKETGV